MSLRVKYKLFKIFLITVYLVSFVVISYYNYQLMLNMDNLEEKYKIYCEQNYIDERDFTTQENYEMYINDVFTSKFCSYLFFYLFVYLIVMFYYFYIGSVINFYVCNDTSPGKVEKDYGRFVVSYTDKYGKVREEKADYLQPLLKKAYYKRKGNIDVHYHDINPNRFIVGNKPNYLIKNGVKPIIKLTFFTIFGIMVFISTKFYTILFLF